MEATHHARLMKLVMPSKSLVHGGGGTTPGSAGGGPRVAVQGSGRYQRWYSQREIGSGLPAGESPSSASERAASESARATWVVNPTCARLAGH